MHPSLAICEQMRQVKCLLKASRWGQYGIMFGSGRPLVISTRLVILRSMHDMVWGLTCTCTAPGTCKLIQTCGLFSYHLFHQSNQPQLHQCILCSSCESSNLFHCWLATVTYTRGIQLTKMTEPWSINAIMLGNTDRAQLTDNRQASNLWWLMLETLGKADELEIELETGRNKLDGFFSPGRLECTDVSTIAWVGISCPSIRQA